VIAATFKVSGPFKIPVNGTYGRYIETGCPDFWNSTTNYLAKERGCYLFAIRASRGFRPVYVGKTLNSFQKECFTHHKIADHYTPALANTGKGTPVLFFVVLSKKKWSPEQSSHLTGGVFSHPECYRQKSRTQQCSGDQARKVEHCRRDSWRQGQGSSARKIVSSSYGFVDHVVRRLHVQAC
jgi:hypothetical protein